MKLVLIGGKSSLKVESVIRQNLDNVDISIYPSIVSFVDTASIRTMVIDRFILLPDATNRCSIHKRYYTRIY